MTQNFTNWSIIRKCGTFYYIIYRIGKITLFLVMET